VSNFTTRWKVLYDVLHGATVSRGRQRERLLERVLVEHGIDVVALKGQWDFEIPSRRIRFDSKSAGWSWGTKADQAVHKYVDNLPDGWTGYLVPFVPPTVLGWKWPTADIEAAGILVRPAHVFLEEMCGEPVDVYHRDEELYAGLLDDRLESSALPDRLSDEIRAYLFEDPGPATEIAVVSATGPRLGDRVSGGGTVFTDGDSAMIFWDDPMAGRLEPDGEVVAANPLQAALAVLLDGGSGLLRFRRMTVGAAVLLEQPGGGRALVTIDNDGTVEWLARDLGGYAEGEMAFEQHEAILRTGDH